MTQLEKQIPPDWYERLKTECRKDYFKALDAFVQEERKKHQILPAQEHVFEALKRTPFDTVKVVLLGQDPYPTPGNAMGLSFSVPYGRTIPASLRNIFKVLATDVGVPLPNHGNLEAWTKEGILLLNTVLTVRANEANSHKNKGWEIFTKAILKEINERSQPSVFLLLGRQAQQVKTLIDSSKHAIVKAPHPSPLNRANPFGKSRPFSEVNNALKKLGQKGVRWELPLKSITKEMNA